MTSGPTLQTFDAGTAQPLVDQFVAVYLEIYPGPSGDFHGEGRYRTQLTSHMKAPGWKLVSAAVNGELVGYAYGFPLGPTSRWWEGMQTAVPADFVSEDGHRTFGISEIMVRLPWRRRGIARALHDELLVDRSEDRATLLAEPDNASAQSAYAAWGWAKVAELRPHWDHAPLYDVLVLALPLTSSLSDSSAVG